MCSLVRLVHIALCIIHRRKIMAQKKICKNCNKNRSIDEYYKYKKDNKYTYRGVCIECYNIQRREKRLKDLQKSNPAHAKQVIKYRQTKIHRENCPESKVWCSSCAAYLDENCFPPSVFEKRQGYCNGCYRNYQVENHRLKKKRAIKHLGGKCRECGWEGHYSGFDFHHKNPDEKEMHWGDDGMRTKSWEVLLPELDKCILLCSCCHKIVHCKVNDDGSVNSNYIPAKGNEK